MLCVGSSRSSCINITLRRVENEILSWTMLPLIHFIKQDSVNLGMLRSHIVCYHNNLFDKGIGYTLTLEIFQKGKDFQ